MGLQLKTDRWLAYVAYTYTDATFQSGFSQRFGLGSNRPDQSTSPSAGNTPGILTSSLHRRAAAIGASTAFLLGDEANLTPPLPGYFTMNLSTSYQLTSNIQLFAWAQNITNARYFTFGTFSPTSSVFLSQALARPTRAATAQPRRSAASVGCGLLSNSLYSRASPSVAINRNTHRIPVPRSVIDPTDRTPCVVIPPFAGHSRIKGRYGPMRGFKSHACASRFCRCFDELRNHPASPFTPQPKPSDQRPPPSLSDPWDRRTPHSGSGITGSAVSLDPPQWRDC